MDKYFDKFPVIEYGNTQVVDITRRVTFANNTMKDPFLFYPYDISNGERPDQLAYSQYDDPYLSWILYMSNDIVDPYYEWYLSEEDLQSLVTKKYGSMDSAMEKVKFWRSDWTKGDTISISAYNALPATLVKYWEPQYGLYGNIVSYTRKQEDTVVNTNNIRSYEVANNSFVIDEVCVIHFSDEHEGKGQVLSVVGNTLFLQHTSGTTLSNTTVTITGSSYVYGKESGVNTSFTSAVARSSNILPEEESYYAPVTYYDYEREKNEYNKTLRVIKPEYTNEVSMQMKDLLG